MKLKQRCLSSAALTAVASAVFVGAPAFAQEDRKEIIVTGSLIRGTPEDAALPVDVITSEELGKQGSPSILELVKALPTSNGVLGDSNQFDSRSQGAEGIASVNLRGLGPARTLVLLNNRRMVSAGNGVPAVDINMIPPSAIARLEVLKDGAAATYGSDAIGGVVNFITKTNQDGFEASADYKYVKGSRGDYNLGLSFGKQTDDFSFLFAAAFQHRSELMTSDRDFALLDYVSNPEGGWTGGGNPASLLTLGPRGIPNSGVRADPDCAVLGGFVTALNRCATQYTGFDALTDTENRAQVFFDATGDITDSIKLRFNALYGYTEVPHYRTSPTYLLTQSPSPSVNGGLSPFVPGFAVPTTNPGYLALIAEFPTFAPAGTTAAVFPTLLFRPHLVGGNPGQTQNKLGSSNGYRESNSFRVSSDLSFALSDNLDLTVSGTYHLYDRYIDGFDSFGDRVQLALRGFGGPNCTGTVAGANGCMWLNPFGNAVAVNPVTGQANTGPIGPANTAELTNWFFVKSYSRAVTELIVADATISGGTGINLPGGEINFGVGAQYRKNKFKITYGANNNLAVNPCRDTPINGNMTCSPQNGALAFLGTNRDGEFQGDVKAVFAEIQAPVFEGFDLQLAARYEDYGGATGSTFDPKITARWEATDWFSVRGSYGTTFRGPPPQQLSPGSVTSLQVIANSFRPVDVFGNPTLSPETATNYSFGAIVDVGGFKASLDYWNYDLSGQIVAEPLSGMVAEMFRGQGTVASVAAPNCSNPAFAGLLSRFTFNGICRDSNIARVRTQQINGAGLKTDGLDLIANYRGDVGTSGSFGIGGSLTYILNYDLEDQIVEGVIVQRGFDAVSKLNFQTTAYPLPEWKGQYYVEYSQGIATGRFTFSYIDGYTDNRSLANLVTGALPVTGPFRAREDIVGAPRLTQGAKIKYFATADFSLQLQPMENTTVNLTVLNITDRDPSFARLDYSYDPFTGNPLGRQFKIGINQKF